MRIKGHFLYKWHHKSKSRVIQHQIFFLFSYSCCSRHPITGINNFLFYYMDKFTVITSTNGRKSIKKIKNKTSCAAVKWSHNFPWLPQRALKASSCFPSQIPRLTGNMSMLNVWVKLQSRRRRANPRQRITNAFHILNLHINAPQRYLPHPTPPPHREEDKHSELQDIDRPSEVSATASSIAVNATV